LWSQHIEHLKRNIIVIICKLEMIFLTLFFFDSIEHLPIHLTYKAKVGGLVQYKWMYYLERLGITCILIVWCFLKTFGHSIYICLPSCMYFSTSRNMLKTMRMLRPWYAKLIFLKRFQHLSHIILNPLWEQESITFKIWWLWWIAF
jgi:hypothetical protein